MIVHPSTYEFLVADRQRELRAESRRWGLARIARRSRRERLADAVPAATAPKLRVVRESTSEVSPRLVPSVDGAAA